LWIAAVNATSKYRLDKANQGEASFAHAPKALAQTRAHKPPDKTMTITEEAQRLFKPHTQPESAMSEYEREQRRIRENLERLKAERLAREAAADDDHHHDGGRGGGGGGDAAVGDVVQG
jgi:hypothetical protein